MIRPCAGRIRMARRAKPGQRRKARFLAELQATGSAALAADAAGLTYAQVQALRDADPVFAQAWADAMAEAVDRAEAEVYRRAFRGVDRPVYYAGQQVGIIRDYSDSLAALYLKAHRPEIYRDRADPDAGKHSGPLRVVIADDWDRDPADD